MKICKIVCLFFVFTSLLCTCNDPVFYAISEQIRPIKPRISGVPTNFVICNNRMYVASGIKLFSYYSKDGDPSKPYWYEEPAPGEVIIQIAVINNKLYALCATDTNNNGKPVIKCYDNNSWTEVLGIHKDKIKIQNIIAANDILFILVTAAITDNENQYAILYYDGNETKQLLTADSNIKNNTGYVNGVAYSANDDSYYLSTSENGVYKVDNSTSPIGNAVLLNGSKQSDGKHIVFTGIINLKENGGDTYLIARDGNLYKVSNSIEKTNISLENMSTGVLAVWTDPVSWKESNDPSLDPPVTPKYLLLAGRQDSYTYSVSYGYRYGYMEIELDSAGISGSAFAEPGKNSFSTININDYELYQSTLGKQPVNFIFQVPEDIDTNMIMFASTQKNGVWSCRKRNDNDFMYWNAEGEDEPEKYY